MHTSIEKIRLVIGYLFNHLSNREIAKTVAVSRETVAKIKDLMIVSELRYEEFTQLSNSALEAKLKINRLFQCTKKVQPDAKYYCNELEKHKGLTKTVLWEEFLKKHKAKVLVILGSAKYSKMSRKNKIFRRSRYTMQAKQYKLIIVAT